MTSDKDRKRRVRARMEKTGESYTAARSQVLRTRPAPIPKDYAERAGMSDDAVKAKTGRTWREWVRTLDDIGAKDMEHRDVAKWVHHETGLDWWSQMVTVGYERIRGLRAMGQRRGGTFEASKSKTVPASAEAAFHAFADEKLRRKWLDVELVVRKATAPRSVRITRALTGGRTCSEVGGRGAGAGSQSSRNAVTGSALVARSAGDALATSATTTIAAPTTE